MPWWEADYNENGLIFTVEGCATNECPVASITGRSAYLVETYLRIKAMQSLGAQVPLDDWPSWIVDGFIVLANEEAKLDVARAKAGHASKPG